MGCGGESGGVTRIEPPRPWPARRQVYMYEDRAPTRVGERRTRDHLHVVGALAYAIMVLVFAIFNVESIELFFMSQGASLVAFGLWTESVRKDQQSDGFHREVAELKEEAFRIAAKVERQRGHVLLPARGVTSVDVGTHTARVKELYGRRA